MTVERHSAQLIELCFTGYTADRFYELARQETEKAHASNRDGTRRAALHFTNAAFWRAHAEERERLDRLTTQGGAMTD